MRIMQILPELNVGGVETGTVDFAKYLVDAGHDSIVVSNGGMLTGKLQEEGSRHYALPVHRKSIWTAMKMVKQVRTIIQDEKIQIVHARSRVPAWIAYFACRGTKASLITTCHGFYHNRIFSQIMGWPKLIIVPSEAIARHMIETYKVPCENIRCIARSVDLNRFNPRLYKPKKEGSCIIAIVGRITTLKGHKYFLQSMAKVIRNVPYAKVWIIGDASAKKKQLRQDLETLVVRLGIKDNVTFLGNQKNIPQLLSEVDVLCFSSIEPESFGRAIVEAQAMKVPVVATKVGGVVDIIDDEETGFLVMPKDTEAMADRVLQLLKDKKLAKKFTQAAIKKIHDEFTVEIMAEKTLEVYEELLKLVNILVIKISSIGDVVLVTASLKALRAKFPESKIYCVVGTESLKILHNCPYLDGILVYDHKGKDRGPYRLWKFSKKIRQLRFDKVIDFQNNRKSHLLAFLSVAPETFGFDNKKWSRLLTHPLKEYQQDIPAVEHQFQILKELGIPYKKKSYLELWPSKKDQEYVKKLLDSEWLGNTKNIVGINVAASVKWTTKNWPAGYIVQLCDQLGAKNIRVVLTGMNKDLPVAQYIHKNAKSKPAVLAGKTDVLQLAMVIKQCKAYVTPDSAPMHVAAAVNTPIIALFGPTDARRHVPPARKIAVLEKKLNCSPCYSSTCKIKTHACMVDIKPEEVLEQIYKFME